MTQNGLILKYKMIFSVLKFEQFGDASHVLSLHCLYLIRPTVDENAAQS